MQNNQKNIVIIPAYNAALTLESTYSEILFEIVYHVVLVDDGSRENTIKKAREIGIRHVIVHRKNRGYGGNQKT